MITKLPTIKRIIFDLDSTLFDTEFFKEKMYEIATMHGYSHEEAVGLYQTARLNGDTVVISMPHYLSVLQKRLDSEGRAFNAPGVTKILNELEAHDGRLPGVGALLTFCNEHDFDKRLLSLGVHDWQEKKLHQARLHEFFSDNEIVYTTDERVGKVEMVQQLADDTDQGEGIILINDKPTEIDEMMTVLPKMITFARREERDQRYNDAQYQALEEKYPGQLYWSNNLIDIRDVFEKLYE